MPIKYEITFDIPKAIAQAANQWKTTTNALTMIAPLLNKYDPIGFLWAGGNVDEYITRHKWKRAYNSYVNGYDLSLDFYLAPEDSLKSFEFLIGLFENDEDFEFNMNKDFTDKRTFRFKHLPSKIESGYGWDTYIYITINLHFKRSYYCKTVGTGKFIEETKTVCY